MYEFWFNSIINIEILPQRIRKKMNFNAKILILLMIGKKLDYFRLQIQGILKIIGIKVLFP